MRFDSIKDIDNMLMPNTYNMYTQFTTNDFGKLMWACPIIKQDEKVRCNFIVPVVVSLDNTGNMHLLRQIHLQLIL